MGGDNMGTISEIIAIDRFLFGDEGTARMTDTTQSVIEQLEAEVECKSCREKQWVPWGDRWSAVCRRCQIGRDATLYTGRKRWRS